MSTVFADTLFYFAFLNPDDLSHAQAKAFLETFAGKMVTTTWVLTESADGLAAPEDRHLFVRFHEALSTDPDVTIVPPDSELFEAGIAVYAGRTDKNWSLTDCISFVVMRWHDLNAALTGDRDFGQAGFNTLLK